MTFFKKYYSYSLAHAKEELHIQITNGFWPLLWKHFKEVLEQCWSPEYFSRNLLIISVAESTHSHYTMQEFTLHMWCVKPPWAQFQIYRTIIQYFSLHNSPKHLKSKHISLTASGLTASGLLAAPLYPKTKILKQLLHISFLCMNVFRV